VDLSGATCAVDVGGGNGALLCALAQANPHLKGVVYDLPHSRDARPLRNADRGVILTRGRLMREAFWRTKVG
jgi:hypothetical protein